MQWYRFRQVPTFGRGTIRRFNSNMSSLKGIAARDYEDIFQCIIPVFEDLLPEPHNFTVRKLLFTFATWHALAKLRLHTEDTLKLFEDTTRMLGIHVRTFVKITCKHYDTRELPREETARKRRAAVVNTLKKGDPATTTTGKVDTRKCRRKVFNPGTYKWHTLPD
ncbi:hypothetical protein K474DRAFT_1610329, partial [Panus rudis PR-1116 ss-1]